MSDRVNNAPLSYEAWTRELFDRPVPFDLIFAELAHYEESPSQFLKYLTRLWMTSGELCRTYSSEQIGQGLWHLHSSSGFLHLIYDSTLPLPNRVAAVEQISTLFNTCFGPLSEPALGHLNQGRTVLNGAAYIFWDGVPLTARSRQNYIRDRHERLSEYEQIEDACLRAMEHMLSSEFVAVQESAVHGLGHWRDAYPERVELLLDRVIADAHYCEELRSYAHCARHFYIQ